MKKTRHTISKKFLPSNARRVTNTVGKRVWLINGIEFESKAEYVKYLQDLHDMSKIMSNGKTVAENMQAVGDDMPREEVVAKSSDL